jgi:hypothetical protein
MVGEMCLLGSKAAPATLSAPELWGDDFRNE